MKKTLLLAIFLIVAVPNVFAITTLSDFDTASPSGGAYLVDYPHWVAVNDTATIYVKATSEEAVRSEFALFKLGQEIVVNKNISGLNVVRGTINSGNITSLGELDQDILNVSEQVGVEGLDIRINFSGVTEFYQLKGVDLAIGDGKTISAQLWNFGLSQWEDLYNVSNDVALAPEYGIANNTHPSTDYISGGVVRMRYYHPQAGVASDYLLIDQVSLINSTDFSSTEMEYLPSYDLYRIYVTSTAVENDNFTVKFYDVTNGTVFEGSDTLRFREPFNHTFTFYKNTNSTNTKLELYDNKFQYVLLKVVDGENNNPYDFNIGFLDSEWMTSFSGFAPAKSSKRTYIYDNDIYLWGRVVDGVGEIQLYDNETYELYLLNSDYYQDTDDYYEFNKPIRDTSIKLKSNVVGRISINSDDMSNWNIFISWWEVFKWHMAKNLAIIIGFLFVWVVAIIFLTNLALSFVDLPSEGKGAVYATVIGGIITVTTPIFILLLRLII